jgi:type III secretion protein L
MSDRIIKAGATVVKGDTYDAKIDASRIVDAARAQARSIVEAAQQERQAILDAARHEGYEHGLREWNSAVGEVDTARDRYLADSELELIRLAVRIAQKILAAELRLNPEAIVSLARESMQSLGRERSLTLRVSPDSIELMRDRIHSLRETAGPRRSIEVVPDRSVEPGGCIVESEYGVIDARLETQMRCMEELLLRAARK